MVLGIEALDVLLCIGQIAIDPCLLQTQLLDLLGQDVLLQVLLFNDGLQLLADLGHLDGPFLPFTVDLVLHLGQLPRLLPKGLWLGLLLDELDLGIRLRMPMEFSAASGAGGHGGLCTNLDLGLFVLGLAGLLPQKTMLAGEMAA